MKFHWFHLMPYPNLPEDFRDRYRGVWVDAPARELFDPVLGHELYHEYLDELEYADELGFDGVVATDCLEMDAIANGIGTVRSAVEALLVGAAVLAAASVATLKGCPNRASHNWASRS